MKRIDRIAGCLAGLAIGDALGMPTEFLTPQQIRAEFGWIDHFVPAPAWHPHACFKPGQVTDDTGQTLAVLHALGEDGRLTAGAIARELLRWADSEGDTLTVIVGPSTSRALELLRLGADPHESGKQGKSNGAAYRAAGLGLLHPPGSPRLVEQVVETCLPTHGTTTAISGAMAVAYATAAACIEGTSIEDVLTAAREGAVIGREYGEWAWSTPLEKRIDLAVKLVHSGPTEQAVLEGLYNFVGTDMLVAESVAAAFGVVLLAEGNPMKAVVYGANIGGDTDTIAAIAGAVCGALGGIGAIDSDLLRQVENINRLDLAGEARRLEAIAVRLEYAHGG